VRCSAESEAEPPVIWSEDEDEDGEHNSASVPEPQTFKQAMHGQQSDVMAGGHYLQNY